jgi:hypothetical protein
VIWNLGFEISLCSLANKGLGRKEGKTLSPHGVYAQGNTHPTMPVTMGGDLARGS